MKKKKKEKQSQSKKENEKWEEIIKEQEIKQKK